MQQASLKPPSIEEALAHIFSKWFPQPKTEVISVADAAMRVLAEDQFARYDLPMVRASSMDGIAVRSTAFQNGMPDTAQWKLGEDYVRADTGDDFDDAFDAVIPIEDVTLLESGGVCLADYVNVEPMTNVRPRGSNLCKETLVARRGTLLRASDLGAIVMCGIKQIPVICRPRVAFIPTGNELVPMGTALQRGQYFDVNSVMLMQMLREMGAEPLMHPIVKDIPEAITQAISEMLPQSDIVIVNAGTSKGGEDYCFQIMEKYGEVFFHGVAAVPGRPISAALFDSQKLVWNISGPPVAAFVSADWAIRRSVCNFLGLQVPQREQLTVTLTTTLQGPPEMSMAVFFQVKRREDGGYDAHPLVLRGPHAANTTMLLCADALYRTQIGEPPHAAGETIQVELIRNKSEIS